MPVLQKVPVILTAIHLLQTLDTEFIINLTCFQKKSQCQVKVITEYYCRTATLKDEGAPTSRQGIKFVLQMGLGFGRRNFIVGF